MFFLKNKASSLSVCGALLACAAVTAAAQTSDCSVDVQVDDTWRFSPMQIDVPASCASFSVLLSHKGRLPKIASPRNWVLIKAEHANGVARDAEIAGAANNWIKPADERVLAASGVIGRGQSVRVQIDMTKLDAGTSYTYMSTIPGFSPVLRGTLTVVP